MRILNLNLMRHPMNWLVLWSMALVFGYLLHLLTAAWNGTHPGVVGSGASANINGPGGPGTTADASNPN